MGDTPTMVAVVLTALGLERQAVCDQLGATRTINQRDTEYALGSLDGTNVSWTVVVGETRAGNVSAAIHVGRAIEVFAPDVLLFVGVAGGVKDLQLGDIVAADAVHGYETGKDSDAFLPRGRTDRPPNRLVRHAMVVRNAATWVDRIQPSPPTRRPIALVGPIAAGEKVVASTRSATYDLLRRSYSDVVAVEMEGSGFLQAAYEYDAPALVVRGISDLLDDKVPAADEVWQPVAARHAAAFAVELLHTYVPPRSPSAPYRPPPEFVAPGTGATDALVVAFAPVDRAWGMWVARVLREAGYVVTHRETSGDHSGTVAIGDVPLLIDDLARDEATARKAVIDAAAVVPAPYPAMSGLGRLGDAPRFPAAMPPIWHVPFPRAPKFTGREEELRALAELLAARETTVVHALAGRGGVGKSTLAVEHAYRRIGDYDVVWWLRAEDPSVLAADFAALAAPLTLTLGEYDQEVAVAAVRRWLEEHARWLLVFDNAGEPESIARYLPRRRTGHVLVTSRNQHWADSADVLTLDVPPEDEAIAFLRRRAGLASDDAVRLAGAVGRLPKAMEVAAAYLLATRCPVDEYLARVGPVVDDLFAVSFEQVERNPVAAAVLDSCALLAPEDIPRSLLVEVAGGADELDRAVRELLRYSLVDAAGDAVSVHRLVQSARRRTCGNALDERAAAVVSALADALPARIDDPAGWPVLARLLPHVLVLAERYETAEVATLLNRVGNYQRTASDLTGARSSLERAVAISEASLSPAHPAVATALGNLALVLKELGDAAGARPLLERALAIDEAALGPAHPAVAVDLSNLAMVLKAQGDAVGARPLLERALAIDEAELGRAHPAVATTLGNLALVLGDLGDAAGARPLLERALAINEAALGPAHPTVATTVGNLALVLKHLGDAAGARPLLERALAIKEAALGPAHPAVATALGNLALVLQDLGDAAGARPLLERALAIDEAALGPAHPGVAVDLGNLALVLQDLGNAAGARPLLERALAIDETALGPAHPAVATTLGNLATVLGDLGDAAGARPLLERALAINEAALGPAHPAVAVDLSNLAMVLKAQGDAVGARPLLERAVAIKEAALGPVHPAVATDFGHLATVLQDLGDAAGARRLLERALAIARATYGADDRRARWLTAALADLDEDVLAGRRRLAEEVAAALLAVRAVPPDVELTIRPGFLDVPTSAGRITLAIVAPDRLDAAAIPVPAPGQALVVVADAIPEPVRRELARRGWGWFDRRGHLRIVAAGLDVDAAIPTAASRGRRRRLFGAVGIDVAFELLVEPEGTAGVRPLARATARSVAQVSTVLARFREEGLVLPDDTVNREQLFEALAEHWRPHWEYLAALPDTDDPMFGDEPWVVADTAAAVAWGVPLVTSGDYPPHFYVPDERVLRHATRVLGTTAPGRHACAVALPPARGVLVRAVPRDGAAALAHPVAVALDLARDPRGREALASWDPPPGYARVW
ncbi:MAG TPA: FxSxx-COOH system tetratricopeptide repeat protein [Frankiaceae bacterium]|nr:FxSxx-COOH system tetratricopeptide repeat protein [Frankiaceae bacterium]